MYKINGQNHYTLKEKYLYYKKLAESGINSKGQKVGFCGRVGLASKANRTLHKMGRNKRRFDYYNR